jgi:hypothetical protein
VAVTFTPTEQWQLAADGCSGVTIASGDACVVSVTFKPTATASFTSSLTVGVTGKSATTQLVASGLVPAFVFSQQVGDHTVPITGLDFGTVAPGEFSEVKKVIVTNRSNRVGSTATTISDTASFSIMSTDCPSTLDVGASCTVSLRFVPRSPGDKPATLQYRSTEGTPTLSLHGIAQ